MRHDVQGQPLDPDSLMEDAILIASYGRRTGRLTDTALFDGIQKAGAVDTLTWGSPELVDLQAATNEAVKQIKPVTLMDLKTWDPFARESMSLVWKCAYGFGKSFLVLFTFLLIIVCGYYTIWQKQASEIFERAVRFDTVHEEAEINELINLWVLAGNLSDLLEKNTSAADPVVREARLKAGEIRFAKIQREHLRASFTNLKNTYTPWAYKAHREFEENKKVSLQGPSPGSKRDQNANPENKSEEGNEIAEPSSEGSVQTAEMAAVESQEVVGASPNGGPRQGAVSDRSSNNTTSGSGPATAAQFFPAEQGYQGGGIGDPDACKDSREKLITLEGRNKKRSSEFTLAPFQHDYLVRQAAKRHIKCLLDIRDLYPQAYIQVKIDLELKDELRNNLHVLSRWALPALYGALGAMLFTIRTVLNPMLPDPKAMHIMLRVSLGAFAGISLGWFGTEAGGPDELHVAGISLGLLTLAFLFGFAIDVFFTTLDRMVATASNAVSNIGAAK